MELGSEQQDLAADVDTGLVAEDDLEALDTDDEEAEEQSLGIDTEESEGASDSPENRKLLSQHVETQILCILCRCTRYYPTRSS